MTEPEAGGANGAAPETQPVFSRRSALKRIAAAAAGAVAVVLGVAGCASNGGNYAGGGSYSSYSYSRSYSDYNGWFRGYSYYH